MKVEIILLDNGQIVLTIVPILMVWQKKVQWILDLRKVSTCSFTYIRHFLDNWFLDSAYKSFLNQKKGKMEFLKSRFACNQKICTNNFFTIITEGGVSNIFKESIMRRRLSIFAIKDFSWLLDHVTYLKMTTFFTGNCPGWKKLPLCELVQFAKSSHNNLFFSQLEINHMSWQSTEVCYSKCRPTLSK